MKLAFSLEILRYWQLCSLLFGNLEADIDWLLSFDVEIDVNTVTYVDHLL